MKLTTDRPAARAGQTTDRPAASAGQRARASRDELIERIMAFLPTDGMAEPLPGVLLHRAAAPTELGHGVSFPFVCVIAQGSKELLLGDRCYRYDPGHYLLATATLPVASQIREASPERPYLSVRLTLAPALVGSVLVEAGPLAPRSPSVVPAIDVSSLNTDLLDAVVRLVRLVDAPAEARVLAPLLTREIVFRLLLDAQGGRLGHIAALGGATHRIMEAIERLRHNFDQPLCIEDLARVLGMSVSGLHHQFRAVTALSPLQFQKHLRLQEARRLLLNEGLDATSAGYRVGYGNASQFIREYKRHFGAPPMHDMERLRDGARDGTRDGTRVEVVAGERAISGSPAP